MTKITPFLWFDDEAEEAAKFYTSVFKGSKVRLVTRYGESASRASGQPLGSVMTVDFDLAGQRFTALNGGPAFKFNESISFMVQCGTQREIDYYWRKLSAGGPKEAQQCGWLKDRFGVSWQIVPSVLMELLREPATCERVMAEVIHMKKLDLAKLKRAAAGAVHRSGRRKRTSR